MAVLDEVTDATFQSQVLDAEIPVLVDFWAEWCGPCRRMHAILERLSDEMEDQVQIVRFDAGTNFEVPAAQGVMNLPTLILYVGGQERDRFGFLSEGALRQRLERHLG